MNNVRSAVQDEKTKEPAHHMLSKFIVLKEPMIIICLVTIVTGSIIIGYATSLQNAYNNARVKTIDPQLEGFFVIQNETGLTTDMFQMWLSLEPPGLSIFYMVTLESNGSYNFEFYLPFRIKVITDNQSFPLEAKFELVNNETQGSIVLISLNRQGPDRTGETISASFTVEETFISGSKGTYFANIRLTSFDALGSLVWNSIWTNLTEWLELHPDVLRLPYKPMPVKNFVFRLVYPTRMTLTQASPEYTIGPAGLLPRSTSAGYWSNLTSLVWYFEELNFTRPSIVVHYVDSQEANSFQQTLFNSGLWYGLGFAITLRGVFELVERVLHTKERQQTLSRAPRTRFQQPKPRPTKKKS
jgi:hypothetical protein